MRRFFEEHKLNNDSLSKERINDIKTSVLVRVEGDKPMKKRRFIKPLVIAIAATLAFGLTTIVSVAAYHTWIVEIDGVHYEVYQQDQFNTVAKQIDGYEVDLGKTPPSESEFTLVNTNEYVDGDYRYVDNLFKSNYDKETGLKNAWWEAWHEIYYEPDSDDSTHLATMHLEGRFFIIENQNVAYVDDDIIVYETIKSADQTYPIVTDIKKDFASEQDDLFEGKRYAYIEYKADVEISESEHKTHTVKLVVTSDGAGHIESSF